MAVYYSFHFDRDCRRVQHVINMGQLEGQRILNSQDWESVKAKGKANIEKWIDEQMKYKETLIVLVGKETASRPWVRHEIIHAWNAKKKILGVRIHNLKDPVTGTDTAGADPFAQIKFKDSDKTLANYITLHDPGSDAYNTIKANLKSWIASAHKPT